MFLTYLFGLLTTSITDQLLNFFMLDAILIDHVLLLSNDLYTY